MKTLTELKATLLDDDAFRLLALPFGGPIPFPGAPRGADLDRQWFSEQTDFGTFSDGYFTKGRGTVPVTWHHGLDSKMGTEVVGKAGDLEFDDDGGWVKVWLDHGKRRTRLIKMLAEAAKDDDEVGIYGSSEATQGSGLLKKADGSVRAWRPKSPGEITRWWYSGQTLSTSPQNTKSILVPVKATLDDLASGELEPTPDYYDALARWLDDLAPNPAPTLLTTSVVRGDGEAKAGRILSGRNEARLREALGLLDSPYDDSFRVEEKRRTAAVDAIKRVLDELEDRYKPVEL